MNQLKNYLLKINLLHEKQFAPKLNEIIRIREVVEDVINNVSFQNYSFQNLCC